MLLTSVVDPNPDPHRDGENGSGTNLGSIKGSQNKGENFFFYNFFISFIIYNNNLFKKRKYKLRKT